jgi:hypothetical protein
MDMAFKQSIEGLQGFDLRGVLLLNNQSNVDIFCNKEFVSNIRQAPEPLILNSNSGELITHHIANVADYDEPVWFSKKAITNIFMLKNMKKEYRVTYDSLEETFLVHREAAGLPNFLFKEHGYGLNFFDPRQADFAFVKWWNQTCGCIPNGRSGTWTRHAAFMLALDSAPEKTSCGF